MKIFVAVGTTHFDSLVQRMDEIAPRLDAAVVMQIGIGTVEPKNASFFRFATSLRDHIAGSDLVVSHGGFGILTESLGQGKKVVAVQNPDMHGDHQGELIRKFWQEGYITWCRDISVLEESIHEAARSVLRPYAVPECSIGSRIREFLGAPAEAEHAAEERR